MAEVTYLTVSDVAKQLNVSRSHIYKAIQAGHFPHVDIGGTIRIPSDKLAEYLNRRNGNSAA